MFPAFKNKFEKNTRILTGEIFNLSRFEPNLTGGLEMFQNEFG